MNLLVLSAQQQQQFAILPTSAWLESLSEEQLLGSAVLNLWKNEDQRNQPCTHQSPENSKAFSTRSVVVVLIQACPECFSLKIFHDRTLAEFGLTISLKKTIVIMGQDVSSIPRSSINEPPLTWWRTSHSLLTDLWLVLSCLLRPRPSSSLHISIWNTSTKPEPIRSRVRLQIQ